MNLDEAIDSICKCVKCRAKKGECSCWLECGCGWFFENIGHNPRCNNPQCDIKWVRTRYEKENNAT